MENSNSAGSETGEHWQSERQNPAFHNQKENIFLPPLVVSKYRVGKCFNHEKTFSIIYAGIDVYTIHVKVFHFICTILKKSTPIEPCFFTSSTFLSPFH